jgi:hypothetical protein
MKVARNYLRSNKNVFANKNKESAIAIAIAYLLFLT